MVDSIFLIKLISVLHVIIAISYYLFNARSKILPSSAFALASGLFLGFPGFYVSIINSTSHADFMLISSVLSLLSLIVVLGMASWGKKKQKTIFVNSRYNILYGVDLQRYKVISYVLLLVVMTTAVLEFWGIRIANIAERTCSLLVFISFLLLLSSIKQKDKLIVTGAILFLISILIYVFLYFDGKGRLILASLLFGLLMPALLPFRKNIKVISLFALALLFVFFGIIRSYEGTSVREIFYYGDGIRSVLAPYYTLASVTEYFSGSRTEYLYGQTFLSSLVFFVPRSIWPDKPFGFGFELTGFLKPELISVGHSMAASYIGEFFANGGFYFTIVGMFILGYLVRVLDGYWMDVCIRERVSGKDVRKFVYTIFLSSGLFTYVWVGTFTFFARDVLNILLFYVLYQVSLLLLNRKIQLNVRNN